MLLQSQGGVIRLFPAVPESWRDAGFRNFRSEGAFLVSASRKGGKLDSVRVVSEKGGKLRLVNSFDGNACRVVGAGVPQNKLSDEVIEVETRPGQKFVFVPWR